MKKEPVQPKEWRFVDELKSPLHRENIIFKRFKPEKNEVDLRKGIYLDVSFPDDKNILATAYNDFKRFLKSAGIGEGLYKITTEKINTDTFESYKIEISKVSCRILSGDTEGIRRALIFVEDMIRRNEGPFLTKGNFKRSPFIKTRISRCFFGPINRPPMNRDELADDVDYYPEEYLNRLAHEGINGLWLSIRFKDLCPSKFFPEHGKDSKRRLEKLKRSVDKCRKYGIKIYVFCIEPIGFGENVFDLLSPDILDKNRYFAGHREGDITYFCTSSKEGLEYLEECSYYIFKSVPELGGLIDINLGERPTHCYSNTENFFENNCPRCSQRKPYEVFFDTLSAIARGIKKASPSAEMISWLYVPYLDDINGHSVEEKKQVIKDIALHIPEDVILQYNFESNGIVKQLGKDRYAFDYWLSWPGPSKIFIDCCKNAVKSGARVSAKIQVGCSHELATVPFVPVPGNLYKKYIQMERLGVSAVMQCWYFGNYPGIMNKSAGELSFIPLPSSEDDFLLNLAMIDWGSDVKRVVKVWKYFQKSYSYFPINLSFSWYGPLHDSITWPLHLIPVDKPIAPSWMFGFPVSGDRIGECICFGHTLDEVMILLKKMEEYWRKGVEIFNSMEKKYIKHRERYLDIILAKAIYLQIKSTKNVFLFYSIRERMPFVDNKTQLKYLEYLKNIVKEEIQNSNALKKLCFIDSRLGFHSEAEGYRYFPAKLDWRMELLKNLLKKEFPEVKKIIRKRQPLFPEYTGLKPSGKSYICRKRDINNVWEQIDEFTEWKVDCDNNSLHFFIICRDNVKKLDNEGIEVEIEPRRLWPTKKFIVMADGRKIHINRLSPQDKRWKGIVKIRENGWITECIIPIECLREDRKISNIRINISRIQDNVIKSSWVEKKPLPYRLIFETDNPRCLGWLIFK